MLAEWFNIIYIKGKIVLVPPGHVLNDIGHFPKSSSPIFPISEFSEIIPLYKVQPLSQYFILLHRGSLSHASWHSTVFKPCKSGPNTDPGFFAVEGRRP